MDIKNRLKKRLLEIPINHNALREKHRLANDLNMSYEDISPLLEELCGSEGLKEKNEYICPVCRDTCVLDNKLLMDIIVEENCFECEECGNLVDVLKNKTGYVFYDILNREDLINN